MRSWIQTKPYPPEPEKVTNVSVLVIAEIRNNKTGEVREYETTEIMEIGADYPNTFNWAENNYSCDCNRRIFFKRAAGEPLCSLDCCPPCSDGLYSVNLKNKRDGWVYYREF
jgi:hypothetical protein